MVKPSKVYGTADFNTLGQFAEVMKQENVLGGALMPDAHLGYTMPIGGVALVEGALYPSWVGYDIGCWVCAIRVKDDIHWVHGYILEHTQEVYESIRNAVPSKEHRHCIGSLPNQGALSPGVRHLVSERSAYRQLGTIGSGNHFIEVAYDEEEDDVWIVIHSGSRGIGHGIAGYWMQRADELGLGGMSCFGVGNENFYHYMADQQWCIEYALTNRVTMLKLIEEALTLDLDWGSLINKVHNSVEEYTKGLYLHRKGATSAKEGELGVIPGNMRDGSVIIKGLGSAESYDSCSHGAGRLYSRGKAKKELSLETFHKDMEGIACYVSSTSLDECPAAYKNFEEVMDAQKDLCVIERHLKPLINIKG